MSQLDTYLGNFLCSFSYIGQDPWTVYLSYDENRLWQTASKDKEKFTEDPQDISDLKEVNLNFPKREILIHLLFSGYEIQHFRALLQNVVLSILTSKKKKIPVFTENIVIIRVS